jgi:hypothetical protein
LIEASDLDYTILRPEWLTNSDDISYETTRKDEPFKGTEAHAKELPRWLSSASMTPSVSRTETSA